MPQVSVIIPTHNRADFVRAAIASVLNQTFQDFDIVVVDDASTDNTSEIVAAFNDERITLLRHDTNKGGAAARNSGILASKCDYIAFLDDDDEWLPEKLAKQMAVLAGSPPDVGCVYTGYVLVDRLSGKVYGQQIPAKRGDLSRELLLANCVGSTSSMLLKRECLKKVGLFDETLPCCQDYDLWIRIAKEFRFEHIQEPQFRYYYQEHNISTNLEALSSGLEILAKKYSDSPLSNKFYSERQLGLGVLYCYAGDPEKAREAFLKAIKIRPLAIKVYFYLCLALLGERNFKKINGAKETLTIMLRRLYPSRTVQSKI